MVPIMNKNKGWYGIAFLILIWLMNSVSATYGQQKTVALFSPGVVENQFWANLIDVTEAACNDLNMNLEVYYCDDDPDLLAKKLNQATSAQSRPDAVLVPGMLGYGERFLKIANENKTPIFTINIGVDADEAGKPREKYEYWIGQLVPDDTEAGYLLADKLVNAAIEGNAAANSGGKIKIYAIAGRKADPPAIERVEGLKNAVGQYPQAEIVKLDYSNWTAAQAREKTEAALGEYPDVSVIWAASDQMALAISNMVRRQGRSINDDIYIGGIDWTIDAINAVSNSELTTTVGGHLIEGGWASVLLFDYFNGKDFASEALMMQTPMNVIDQANVAAYQDMFGDKKWGRINFTLYSKVHKPNLKNYKFTLETMLVQLR